MQIFQRIAETLNGIFQTDAQFAQSFRESLDDLVKNHLPSGNGFDEGCKIDLDENVNVDRKLVIKTSYHHMNDVGFYDGWTHHKVIVTPSLIHGFVLTVKGDNRNKIHEYITDLFYECLDKEYTMNEILQSRLKKIEPEIDVVSTGPGKYNWTDKEVEHFMSIGKACFERKLKKRLKKHIEAGMDISDFA